MTEILRQMLARLDDMDVDGMLSYLAPDVVFKFGNHDPIFGREAVGEMVGGMFRSYVSVLHIFHRQWRVDNVSICEITTTYGLPDGRIESVPGAFIVNHRADDLVIECHIYQDMSALAA